MEDDGDMYRVEVGHGASVLFGRGDKIEVAHVALRLGNAPEDPRNDRTEPVGLGRRPPDWALGSASDGSPSPMRWTA